MAITQSERADILELVVLMFDAAPGAAYLSDIVSAYEASGRSIPALAEVLAQTGAFHAVHPNFETAQEFATHFLATVGLQNDAAARDWVVGQFNAGASKAAIIAAGWAILDQLTEPAAPQYLAAKAILENKAAVSDFYSVVLRESSFSLDVLRDVVADVGADPASVDAAIRELTEQAAQGPVLTPGLDNVQVGGTAHTVVTGLIDGAEGRSGTYTAGDRIRGNGNTDLELTVINGGNAGFVRVEGVDTVTLVAGTDEAITINAGGWKGVGSVRLDDGTNGMAAFLNNLEAGTGLSIAEVTGRIGASQRLGDGRVVAQLQNDDRDGEGGSYRLGTDGSITAQMADEVSLGISVTGDIVLGDVDVEGGSEAGFSIGFSDADEVTVGNITVAMGEEVSASVDFDGIDGDVTVGAVALSAGGESFVGVRFDDIEGDVTTGAIALEAGDESRVAVRFEDVDGDITAGDIALAAGGESSVSLTFDWPGGSVTAGNVTLAAGDESGVILDVTGAAVVQLGSIQMQAGEDSSVQADFGSVGEDGSIATGAVSLQAGSGSTLGVSVQGYSNARLGDVSMTGGDASSATLDIGELGEDGVVTVGNVSMELGDSSDVSFGVGPAAQVSLGDIAQAVGESGSVELGAQAWESLSVGVVSQLAGSNASLSASLGVSGDAADLSVAGYLAQGGDDAFINAQFMNNGPRAGTTTIGDIAASVGNDGYAMVSVAAGGFEAPTEDDMRPTAGDLTVGDITLEAGNATGIDGYSAAVATVLYGGKAEGAELGNISVGDVHITVGHGLRSGTMENYAMGGVLAAGLTTGSLGDASFGNVTIEGGDTSQLGAGLGGLSIGGEDSVLGDASFGKVSMTGGEGSTLLAGLAWGGLAAGTVGDMVAGGIEVNGKEDSTFMGYVLHGAVTGTAASVGDLSLGDVSVKLGDNSDATLAVWGRAAYAGLETDANGDFVIGDIDMAVSATATEDLSGRSSVSVSLRKEVFGLEDAQGGSVTVGDVRLAAGDESEVSFALSYSGTMETAGDVSVGEIALSVGDDSNAGGLVYIRNAGGDIGDVSLGGHALTLGKDATGSSVLVLDKDGAEGDAGDIGMGDITLVLAEGAQAAVSLELVDFTSEASVGHYSIGDVAVDAGKDAIANLAGLGVAAESVGNVTIGDADVSLGAGAAMDFDVVVESVTKVGKVTIGDRALDAGAGATATLHAGVAAGTQVGAVSVGSLTLDLSEGATAEAGVSVEGSKVAGTTIGDTTVAVTDGASANVLYRIQASDIGETLVGDIHLSVADGGALTDDTPEAAALAGSVQFSVEALGDGNDHLQVGDITIAVAGTAEGDRVFVGLQTNGNLVIGDLTVSGKGRFSFDADDAGDANTSVLAVSAGGTRIIGDVDFSAYEGDALIDLAWTTAGAASITGGVGADTIRGNAGANTITAGKGVDTIDISQGGNDTVVTNKGDSGKTEVTLDTILGFSAGTVVDGVLSGGDKLDFNLVAGSAGNYVERADNFHDFEEFISNARDALNSTVRYFVQDDGVDTYVAVNYGSGEADVIVKLAGVWDATSLQFQNFVA